MESGEVFGAAAGLTCCLRHRLQGGMNHTTQLTLMRAQFLATSSQGTNLLTLLS